MTHLVATGFSISLMKQQFVETHQYTILKETEKTRQILNRPTFRHIIFYEDIKWSIFCGHNILTAGVCSPTVQ